MFRLIAFFAILAAAFAAPKPDPTTLAYTAGIPLTYSSIASPISYSNLGLNNLGLNNLGLSNLGLNNLGYNYIPYASGYNYYGTPLAYRNLYL